MSDNKAQRLHHRAVPGTEDTQDTEAVLNTAISTLSLASQPWHCWRQGQMCDSLPRQQSCGLQDAEQHLWPLLSSMPRTPPPIPPSCDFAKRFQTCLMCPGGAWLRTTACASDGLSSDPQHTGSTPLEERVHSASLIPMPGTWLRDQYMFV